MTNNTLREQLNKASKTLQTNAATINGYLDRVPANDDETSSQHEINGNVIAEAAGALDSVVGTVAWTD